MKLFTNKSVIQKIVIAILTVLLLTFAIPKPVGAVTNILLSPVITLATTLLDGIQHLLEWAMLGETEGFMKNIDNKDSYDPPSGTGTPVNKGQPYDESEIDGTLWGADAVNIPVIRYTPEEIFSNRVPSLDVNFINPSVKTGNDEVDQERNIAMRLQPVISSWYVAIRTLALVALLSVLVYLGIRMLITSVAADKAKYKKMLVDWIVGICLLFLLHYIMSFALTMSELLTSMLGQDTTQGINVAFNNGGSEYSFSTNLMGYVRFMIQSTDTATGLGFFFLYLMLVIYSIRFTWVYLKRVVNMAFLTIIAPFVALTYPMDKVSDGSAQAFNMWLKEFSYNAVLQPLHLLLYKVLLGSATELAVLNPLYAVVCLAFILTGEKLLKQMFGFNKAGAGTVGSLAGAAGVTALASKALMGAAKHPPIPGGGKNGKVRTDGKYQREGKNSNAPKDMKSFNQEGDIGIPSSISSRGTNDENVPPPSSSTDGQEEKTPAFGKEQEDEMKQLQEYFDNHDNNDAYLNPDQYQANLDRMEELEKLKNGEGADTNPDVDGANNAGPNIEGSPNPEMTEGALNNIRMNTNNEDEETVGSLWGKDVDKMGNWMNNKGKAIKDGAKGAWDSVSTKEGRKELRRKASVGAYKRIRGAVTAAPAAMYKGIRGGAKLAARGAIGVALGATAGVIAATNGDLDQAAAAALTGVGVGAATGGNIFEGTIGKVAKDVSVREKYGASKYGSVTDYRNEMADRAELKSEKFNNYYEKNFKGKGYTKKEVKESFKSYMEAGVTDYKTIKTAMEVEKKYIAAGGDKEKVRRNVQELVQTKDLVDSRAYRDDRYRENEIKRIERSLTAIKDEKQRRKRAEDVFQGYQDFYDAG